MKLLPHISTRALAALLLAALLLDGGLAWAFSRIPSARAYIPIRRVSSADIYDWTPATAPGWFRLDDPSVPEADHFRQPVAPLVEDGSRLDQYLAIMNWVRAQVVVADAYAAIPGDPVSVHRAMLTGTPAQCGNFATLLAAASTSVGLGEVRTWHLLGDDGPGGQGHVANEVWIPELKQWVFLDPMNNTLVLLDGAPASLFDVRRMVLTGQDSRLTPVTGPNAHTPPDGLFDLYREVMAVPALAAEHTPLRSSYRAMSSARLAAGVPDVAGLRGLAESAIRLVNGESRLIVLWDDLAQANSQPYPVWQVKALFWAMAAIGGAAAGFALLLVARVVAALRVRRAERAVPVA